jgi:hypothetical protein
VELGNSVDRELNREVLRLYAASPILPLADRQTTGG